MGRELGSYVHVYDEDSVAHAFGPGDEVPAWAAKQMGNHCFVEDGESGEPPRSGAGSGKGAWADFAAENGVEVDGDATRDDIIGKLAAAGVVEA